MATTDTNVENLTEWRIAQFEELGFTKRQAERLEKGRYTVIVRGDANRPERRYERLLDWHKVKKLLDEGATKDQLLRIYA